MTKPANPLLRRTQVRKIYSEVPDVVVAQGLRYRVHHSGLITQPLSRPIAAQGVFQVERILPGKVGIAWHRRLPCRTMTRRADRGLAKAVLGICISCRSWKTKKHEAKAK